MDDSFPDFWKCPECGSRNEKTDQQKILQHAWLEGAAVFVQGSTGRALCESCGGAVGLKELASGRFDDAGAPSAEAARGRASRPIFSLKPGHVPGHAAGVLCVAFSPDARRALSGDSTGGVMLWDLQSGEALRRFSPRCRRVNSVAFSPDGRFALLAGGDCGVQLWDLEKGSHAHTFIAASPGDPNVLALAFSPDGRRAMTAGEDGSVLIFDLERGRKAGSIVGWFGSLLRPRTTCVAWSPDGRRALTAGLGPVMKLWDVESGRELARFGGHHWPVSGVGFLPEGRVYSTSVDGTVRLWDLGSAREAECFPTHPDNRGKAVTTIRLALTPDGRFAASAGNDLRVWELASRREVARFESKGKWEAVVGLAISADGRRVLAGYCDKNVRLFSAGGLPLR